MILDNYYAVIMAGGGGTRLWPLSRKTLPKQMLRLFDERTLFQTAVQRLDGIFPPERIYVVTVQEQAEALHAQTPDIPYSNFLIEPMPRGTASVVGLAAMALERRDPQAIMAVLTADHFMADEAVFRRVLASAYEVAQEGYLVTLGIEPTYPATGFGYIQQGEPLAVFDGYQAFRVLRFTEKPDEQQARKMVSSSAYSWNSGMFVWRVKRIMEEFDRHMPALSRAVDEIAADWDSDAKQATLERVWPELKNETIDYGVMEKATKVAVIPAAGLGWSDVGSWDSLFDLLEGDENGNILMQGSHIGLDTKHSLIYAESDERLVVTIGVQNLVLVDTGDVLLVCDRKQAQRVRQIVKQLKQNEQNLI